MLKAYAASTATRVANDTGGELAKLIELVIGKIPLWIAAFIVLVITFILAKMVQRSVENKMAEKGIEEEHKEAQVLIGRVSFTTILIIGITISLKIAGIDLTSIIAAAAFGVGFALRDLIMNFLAGIMILVNRQFTIGDCISVNGVKGRVMEIQSRVTIIQSFDGTKVIVPNADLFSNKVTSYTGNPFRRIEVEASVDYRGNLENALKLCLHVAKNTKGVLAEPKPVVLVKEWGDSEIIILIRVWVESRGGWLSVKSKLYRNLKEAYDKYNINFAWPITQLVYDKDAQADAEEIMFEEEPKATVKPSVNFIKPVISSVKEESTQQLPAQETNDFEKPLKPLGER